jgi:hypothetical protein
MQRQIFPIIIGSTLLWSATASAAERFCLRLPPDNTHIYDASPRVGGFDYQEDYGRRFSDDWGIAFMKVHIETMSGTDVWGSTWCSGNVCLLNFESLDSQGCTGYVDTPGGTLGETFRIRYVHSGSNVLGSTYAIQDCSSSNPFYPSCASATNVIENVAAAAGSNVTTYEDLPMSVENMLAWELAFSIKRFPMIDTPITVKYYDTTAANAQGITSTSTQWSSQGAPQINIRGAGWRNKSTMAHEYGHAYSVFRNPNFVYSDLDYCYNTGGACQHTTTSTEYQSAAATEGFAEFFSAAVWNNAGLNAQAYLVQPTSSSSGTLIDLEFGQPGYELKFYETQVCNGTCTNGLGVELDWARTLWDLYTNYSPAPLMNDLGLVFDEMHPWAASGTTNAYYIDFRDGVESALNSTWRSRFQSVAAANGIDW